MVTCSMKSPSGSRGLSTDGQRHSNSLEDTRLITVNYGWCKSMRNEQKWISQAYQTIISTTNRKNLPFTFPHNSAITATVGDLFSYWLLLVNNYKETTAMPRMRTETNQIWKQTHQCTKQLGIILRRIVAAAFIILLLSNNIAIPWVPLSSRVRIPVSAAGFSLRSSQQPGHFVHQFDPSHSACSAGRRCHEASRV